MKTYRGRREASGCRVTVDDRALDPRLDLAAAPATGFEWGYDGAGPARLALAILADHLDDDALGLSRFKQFRADVIARIRGDDWSLTTEQIDRALAESGNVTEVAMTLDQLLNKVRGRA
ncbi:MAG: DUF6166 domain-containing protein [Alphaproteobacteria bacterium]|jgi:hypothetical protein|nr:DUF6166 domain-containing protein [Alphaproteobacteria bacterium]MDP6515999.1 DUF6166 domain-containing protein [Alphaproteobacteria bacterium]